MPGRSLTSWSTSGAGVRCTGACTHAPSIGRCHPSIHATRLADAPLAIGLLCNSIARGSSSRDSIPVPQCMLASPPSPSGLRSTDMMTRYSCCFSGRSGQRHHSTSGWCAPLNMHQSMPHAPHHAACTTPCRMHHTMLHAPHHVACTKACRMHQSMPHAPKHAACTNACRMHQSIPHAPHHAACTTPCRMHQV